jgi:hypothetical protein
MNHLILFICLFKFILSVFENPIYNYNFSEGLNGWYTETRGQLEIVEGTSGTKAIKMTRTSTAQKGPFIAQWPKWPINQKFTLGMRYKAKLNEGGVVLLSCEGFSYYDTLYLYTNTIDTNDQWVTQYLDTQWTEFIEGKGIFTVQFRGTTTGTFIVDEIFWTPCKVTLFNSLSINVWQSTVYDEEFEIRVALRIKNSIYENGTYIHLNLTVYDYNGNEKIFLDKYKIKTTHLTKYAEFMVNPSKLQPGFYTAKVDIYNDYADHRESNSNCHFRKASGGLTRDQLKKTRKIYIDDKLRTWINGKITFPIGLYAGEYNTTHRDNWVNSPFNMVFNGGSSGSMINELYELSNHRLYSIQYLGHNAATYSHTDEDIIKAKENALNVVRNNKKYEGLIGYYFIDEPGASLAHSMMNTTFGIREEDPNRFVFTAVNQRYSLNAIKEGLDVIGTDCYPATTSDALHCVATVATEGIRNMANAKANWGVIQIYDKTVDGESGQNAPTELELRNMLYQVIAAGAMGLFAFDYASLWHSKAHNPPQSEWAKVVKVFTEFRDVYSKFVYCVDEPFRESYYFPEMIYSIPRGENVIARIWKNESYDYILLVNMDKSKKVVTYKFKKPSPKTCIEIMYGVKEEDITITNEKNEVSVNMPYIGVVWLRGYDSEEDCTDVIKVDPEDLPDYFASSNVALVAGLTVTGIVLFVIGGLVLFLFLKKKEKCCFAPDFDFKKSFQKLSPGKFY